MDNERNDLLRCGIARHAKVGCQLGDFSVPELRRAMWQERNGLEYLSVGPAYGRLFRRHGGQGQQTDA